jgi:SAM-dependent methyltransferase
MKSDLPSGPESIAFDSQKRDRFYWSSIDYLITKHQLKPSQLLRNFQAFAMRRDFPRMLSHYELFKRTQGLPGLIVDLGVFNGQSFFFWAKLLEIFCPFDRSKRVVGFNHADWRRSCANPAEIIENRGDFEATPDLLAALVKLQASDGVFAGVERLELIEGDLRSTLDAFLERNPGLKINLLHFDLDLFEPTLFALERLYDRVVTGGVIILDEYGLPPWEGETRAVDAFFKQRNLALRVEKHEFTQTPNAYLIKE